MQAVAMNAKLHTVALPLVLLLAGVAIAPRPVAADVPETMAVQRDRLRVDRQTSAVPAARCGRRLRRVRLVGLLSTKSRVVTRELLVHVGHRLDCALLRESLQRLRNLGIFRRVDVHVTTAPRPPHVSALSAPVDVTFVFDEKWTLLPIFSAGRGGGRLYLLAGAQDIHVAGRLLEAQAYGYLFAGTRSAVISIADPRVGDRRIRLALTVEHGNRNRYLYRDASAPYAAWSRHRERLSLAVSDLRRPRRTWGVQLHGLWDRFSTRLLTPDLRLPSANEALMGRGLPTDGVWLQPRAWLRLGRVDRDDYLVAHGYVEASLTGGVPVSEALHGQAWGRVVVAARWAWLPAVHGRARAVTARSTAAGPSRTGLARLNLVARLRLGTQLGSHPAHRFFVGGLSAIRGYWESRFAGEHMAAINLEARLPSWHSRWLVIQHVAFVDAGAALAGTLRRQGWRGGVSAGTGLRLILPLIAQFVARVDVAWAIADRDWRISFGSQQFF